MPLVYSANASNILVDGVPIEGLQSFEYDIETQQLDIPAIGSGTRVDVVFGLKRVEGFLVVCSDCQMLEVCNLANTPFQIVARLAKIDGMTQTEKTITLSFDQCFIRRVQRRTLANDVVRTTYTFTSTKVNLS